MKIRLTLLLWMVSSMLWAGNAIFSPRIKSLTSIVDGDWFNRPVMTMGKAQQLNIGFDELSHNYHRFVYHIDHCEADWTVSEGIFESDWLKGFNDNPIEDYQNSINTTVEYTHYQFSIPNERCRLTMSGNYRLTVYDEEENNEAVLQVEFYVVEPLMSIDMEMTTNTDIDLNLNHQQLTLAVNYNNLRVINPESELQTVVMQNWREEQARRSIRPNFINNKGLTWKHNRALIFDAGNEYRKYEILDVSHTTMGLDKIEWDGKYYQAYPFTATVRRNYLTDVDANGAFCIRNSNNTEIDYTCDYVMVNYTLQAPYDGDLYVYGHWTTDSQRESYRMRYDDVRKCYYTTLMQKQGYYSYTFLTADGRLSPTEGSFFQTENQYQVLVYYKETGGRTWRLVGFRSLNFLN